MHLFSREKPKAKTVAQETELQPLDPVALCLALWLSLMTCGFGLVRLMDKAAQRTDDENRLAVSIQSTHTMTFVR